MLLGIVGEIIRVKESLVAADVQRLIRVHQ